MPLNPHHKLHSFGVRLSHNGKELFLLAADPEEAKAVYDKLMPDGDFEFSPSLGDWVYADMRPAPKPLRPVN